MVGSTGCIGRRCVLACMDAVLSSTLQCMAHLCSEALQAIKLRERERLALLTCCCCMCCRVHFSFVFLFVAYGMWLLDQHYKVRC